MTQGKDDFNIDFAEEGALCIITCSGGFRESLFMDLIARIQAHRAAAPGRDRYFVDLRATDYRIDGFARHRIGEASAHTLQGLRIAVLGNAGVIDKITENTAMNRGLSLIVTAEESIARAWLDK